VVKSRAEVIARTESMRAYSVARDERFRAAGVGQVRWWATVDDRTCPLCRPRAGQLYPRGAGLTPLHPRCRCTLTPWTRDLAELDPDYVAAIERHRAQVREAAPVDLNRGSVLGAAF
jgi:SPP1 gp7 family putative phage head morphogenesis protein